MIIYIYVPFNKSFLVFLLHKNTLRLLCCFFLGGGGHGTDLPVIRSCDE